MIFFFLDSHGVTCLSHFSLSSSPLLSLLFLLPDCDRSGFPHHLHAACLPSGPSEDYKRRGQDFKGGLHGANGDGLGGIGGGGQTATQVLKHLPVEHGRLCLASDLMQPACDTTGGTQQRDERHREERYAHKWDEKRWRRWWTDQVRIKGKKKKKTQKSRKEEISAGVISEEKLSRKTKKQNEY